MSIEIDVRKETMSKVEYASRRVNLNGSDIGNIVSTCNEMAGDGWRLASTLFDRSIIRGVWLLFEREASAAVAGTAEALQGSVRDSGQPRASNDGRSRVKGSRRSAAP